MKPGYSRFNGLLKKLESVPVFHGEAGARA
jgi:hypothetical protein